MSSTRFKSLTLKKGLKATRQREEILNIFLSSPAHRNLSEIHTQVSKVNPKIGFATIYRTMKLLTRLGVAVQRKFADGETRYEPSFEGSHHDHLICVDCGKIIEFEDNTLETIQQSIASQHRFKIFYHRMELYGQCFACQQKKRNRKGKS